MTTHLSSSSPANFSLEGAADMEAESPPTDVQSSKQSSNDNCEHLSTVSSAEDCDSTFSATGSPAVQQVQESKESRIAAKYKIDKNETKRLREKQKQELRLQRELKREQEKKEKELKKEREKQEKELKKLEDKKRREEEKKERERKRDEEKRHRELQREQEKREREQRKVEERRKKLEEKAKLEEEKRKKEASIDRSQTKINNFFRKASALKNVVSTKTDFEKSFLPFYVKDGTVMGENFKRDPEQLERMKADLDRSMKLDFDPNETRQWLESHRTNREPVITKSAVELIQQMTSKNKSSQELELQLRQIPHKFIKFYENVRPPYIGTYSKVVEIPPDNPFSTEGTGFDYNYDSDWDWVNEEEEEGGGVEDLEDGDDEDDEDDDPDEGTEDEFEGFLDREDSNGPRSGKKFLGPLIPTIKLRSNLDALDDEDRLYFQLVSVNYLIQDVPFPVDPTQGPKAPFKRSCPDGSTPSNNAAQSEAEKNGLTASTRAKKPKTLITEPKDLLRLFNEIHESTFSLGTITEILQKHLSSYSKDTIRNTVKEYTTRPAAKAGGSRKWLIKDLAHWESLKSLQAS